MPWTIVVLLCLLPGLPLMANEGQKPSYPSFDQETARDHEIKPHRRKFPVVGMNQAEYMGDHYLHLKPTVSSTGDVTHAEPISFFGEDEEMKFWPQVEGEVSQWKFTPFTKGGKAVTAEVHESIVLLPPERLPKTHVTPPPITKDSKVTIELQRTCCDEINDFHNINLSPMELYFGDLMELQMGRTRTRSITTRSLRWRRDLQQQIFTPWKTAIAEPPSSRLRFQLASTDTKRA